MPTNKHLAEKRHKKLIDEYKRLSEVKQYGQQKYSHDWIISHLEETHHYTRSYIEFILKKKL
jgi:hypothetical protein